MTTGSELRLLSGIFLAAGAVVLVIIGLNALGWLPGDEGSSHYVVPGLSAQSTQS